MGGLFISVLKRSVSGEGLLLRFVIFFESLGDGLGAKVTAVFGVEELFLAWVADEVELDEDRGHGGGPEDPEAGLADAFVGAVGVADEVALDRKSVV